MIRQQPGRPGVNPLKAGGNAGGLEQGYQQPQGNQPKGMDLSSYAPGRAQPIQPPSQGTPFQAYNQQQSAPRSPPQFGGDVMFAGGTPYFNERPGPMPRQQKAAPPRETPAVGAQPQVPFTQSAVGVGGQQFSDPSQAFAQRDALIQRINEARAPMFANSGMYMGGAAPPPPQPLDFNALLGQANEMVAGGWQNPFAATTFAPPSQPPVAGMNPGYGNPYVMNTGAGTPFPEAELGDGGRQYYDWAINNPNDPRSSSIVADWEFRQANGPGPTPRPPNPALRPQAPYQSPFSSPSAPQQPAYYPGGTMNDGYGMGQPPSLGGARDMMARPPLVMAPQQGPAPGYGTPPERRDGIGTVMGFPDNNGDGVDDRYQGGPGMGAPQQGQAPAYGQDRGFDSWYEQKLRSTTRDMMYDPERDRLMRERSYQEYLRGGEGGRYLAPTLRVIDDRPQPGRSPEWRPERGLVMAPQQGRAPGYGDPGYGPTPDGRGGAGTVGFRDPSFPPHLRQAPAPGEYQAFDEHYRQWKALQGGPAGRYFPGERQFVYGQFMSGQRPDGELTEKARRVADTQKTRSGPVPYAGDPRSKPPAPSRPTAPNKRDVQAAFENPSAWQYQDPQEASRLAREDAMQRGQTWTERQGRDVYNAANKNNWLGPDARRSVGNMSSDNQRAYLLMGGFNQNEVNDYMKRNSGKGKKKR